jgi:hypothetical protein
VGSFEQMAGSLTENLSLLQQIVRDTIEQSRNLHAVDGIDMANQQWSIEHRLQQSYSNDQRCAELERELAQCQQIVTLSDISTRQLYI